MKLRSQAPNPQPLEDSLAGSIQVNNDAREIRYWIREEEEEVSQALS